jgi:hypothetical protein
MRKRILSRLALLLCIAVGGFLLFVWWTRPKCLINRELFEKIELGMSKDDAEKLLGSPAGYYCTGPAWLEINTGAPGRSWIACNDLSAFERWTSLPPEWFLPNKNLSWVTNIGAVQLVLDPDDKVVERRFYQIEVSGLVQNLRNWLTSDR